MARRYLRPHQVVGAGLDVVVHAGAEDLDGHPHRKDFPIGETPVLFNDGRFIDPAGFRAGLVGKDPGLTGWKGGARDGVESTQGTVMIDAKERGQS